jgi:signal transduction histidine kinase
MIWGWLHRNPRLVDIALVAFMTFLAVASTVHAHAGAGALAVGIVAVLPLLVRRRFPVEVVLAVGMSVLALIALHAWTVPLQLAVALYTLSSLRTSRRDRGLVGAVIVVVAVDELASGGLEFGAAAARVITLLAAALLGESIGARRAYVREIEEKAARLEHERESERRRAVAEEQARIGRELHDVIAHALSVIVVQAGAADDAFDHDPQQAREPIRAVHAAARTALADLRRVLGILQGAPEYEPQPGLAQLDELVERVRATGLNVSLQTEGAPQPLPAAVELSAYRLVQEALTNTLKHAAAERVRVRIRYGDTLAIEVDDDGRGAVNGASVEGGSGLIGMRERVALLGGSLRTGRSPAGGFRVAAEIPLEVHG